MKLVLLAIIIGFLADCVLGDPRSIPHPICLIGKLISKTEKLLRRVFPKTEKGELAAGGVLVVIVVALSAAVPFAILWVANKISVWLWFAVCCVMSLADPCGKMPCR